MLRQIGLRVWVPAEAAAAAAPAAEGAAPTAAAEGPRARAPGSAAQPPAPAAARPPTAALATQTAPAPAVQAAPVPAAHATPAPAFHAAHAPRADVAALDWPGLQAAVVACRACRLCESRTRTVFGSGHLQAHWMVVGEAPGEQEDLSGEPFVGAAGQLLDRMLAALELTRAAEGPQSRAQRVYIANSLKCRPPRNRNPAPAEMAQCEPFLLRQIELLQPRIILAMGRYAVQALLSSDEPVGRLRGRVHRYHGVPLVVTYHPAYLLRNPPDKARAWDDLCLAAQVAEQALAQ
jgi:DNA polymerase